MNILISLLFLYTPVYKVEIISDSVASDSFIQSFIPNCDSIYSVEVLTYHIPANSDSVNIKILDENKILIAKKKLPFYAGKNWIKAVFDYPVPVERGHRYYVEITSNISFYGYLDYTNG